MMRAMSFAVSVLASRTLPLGPLISVAVTLKTDFCPKMRKFRLGLREVKRTHPDLTGRDGFLLGYSA